MPITDKKFWMNWPWSPDSTASVATPNAERMPLHNAGNATSESTHGQAWYEEHD